MYVCGGRVEGEGGGGVEGGADGEISMASRTYLFDSSACCVALAQFCARLSPAVLEIVLLVNLQCAEVLLGEEHG